MTDKIIALGKVAAATNKPVANVVEILRDLLARAEKGEIRAIAISYVNGGNFTSAEWCQGTVDPAFVVGGVTRMLHKMVEAWEDK